LQNDIQEGGEAMSPQLKALIEVAKLRPITSEELEAQEVSFAYGNASYENAHVTREEVARFSLSLKGVDEATGNPEAR
jgi:hypothetical protein